MNYFCEVKNMYKPPAINRATIAAIDITRTLLLNNVFFASGAGIDDTGLDAGVVSLFTFDTGGVCWLCDETFAELTGGFWFMF